MFWVNGPHHPNPTHQDLFECLGEDEVINVAQEELRNDHGRVVIAVGGVRATAQGRPPKAD